MAALTLEMVVSPGQRLVGTLLLALVSGSNARATVADAADQPIKQFLAQDDTQPSYRALRHLEAENGSRRGWVDAVTEYAPETGMRYEVAAEGGSDYIRSKVLVAVGRRA